MALKAQVGQKIMNEVVRSKDAKASKRNLSWRILVVDQLAMRMVSACCKMHDLSAEGITLVEDIQKKREPLPNMEAVYLITPCQPSIESFIKDFNGSGDIMYSAAHVFFTEACPDDLFEMLTKAKVAKYIKTLKEINIAFVPYEEQAYSLDSPQTFAAYYNSTAAENEILERNAEQIATLCATLGEYPAVRYRADFDKNVRFAQLVQQKLNEYKANEPTMGGGQEKARSQLLILDRGFDCTSPLLHELTLQAMAFDLLPIENDVYRYESSPGSQKEVLLDENDSLWVESRHQHIADVTQSITKSLKKFMDSKRVPQGTDKTSIRDLSKLIKLMPQYQKELSKYTTHIHLAEDCMKRYNGYIDKLCKVEQDLALGTDAEGEKVKDQMRNVSPILLDSDITSDDKLRIIALYMLSKHGLSQRDFDKLFQHAQIEEEKQVLENLSKLGVSAVLNGNPKKSQEYRRRSRGEGEKFYSLSRWIPVIRDVMEDCIEGKLDNEMFPFLSGRTHATGNVVPTSARYGLWHKDKPQQILRNVPRLIIFIVGGVSFSEIRCAYEVTNKFKNWEVIIGSTHILTPRGFLNDLRNLSM